MKNRVKYISIAFKQVIKILKGHFVLYEFSVLRVSKTLPCISIFSVSHSPLHLDLQDRQET